MSTSSGPSGKSFDAPLVMGLIISSADFISREMPCPKCGVHVQSEVEPECCLFAPTVCAGMLCCCIPCCLDSYNIGRHYCPNCGEYLGAFPNA